jgi:hypothetical protein
LPPRKPGRVVLRRAAPPTPNRPERLEERRVAVVLDPLFESGLGFLANVENRALSGEVQVDLDRVALLAEVQVEIAEVQTLFLALEGFVVLDADTGRKRAKLEANAVAFALLELVLDLDDRAVGRARQLAVERGLDGVVENLAGPYFDSKGRRTREWWSLTWWQGLPARVASGKGSPVRLGSRCAFECAILLRPD